MTAEPTQEPEFDVEAYQAEHAAPSGVESAFLTVLMFGGLVVLAVGCWALGGWG